ncbi:MAG TPA: glycosyltransferase [Patescibacteria group bacterium]|nr:glycosyltransferase [Patescibacteria group bacterium]
MSMQLSVIIPAYNEENRLPPTLKRLVPYLRSLNITFEVIIVNDGSKDETAARVNELAKEFPEIKLVDDGFNRGRTGAMRRGIEVARGEILLETDSDGSVHDEAIGRFFRELERDSELAALFGSREIAGSKIALQQPWLRVFLGKGFIYLARLVLGMWHFSDFALGFKMIRRDAAAKIFAVQKEKHLVAESEIVYLAHLFNMKYQELPVTWTDNADSRINPFKEVYRSLVGLLRIKLRGIFGHYQKKTEKFLSLKRPSVFRTSEQIQKFWNKPIWIINITAVVAGLAALIAVFVSANSIGKNPVLLTGDAKGYVFLAENLFSRGEFTLATSTAAYSPQSFRTPGYPVFLGALHTILRSWEWVIVVQALLAAFAPLLLYLLIRPYHERVAFFSALIFAFEPVRLFYSSQLLTDAVFTTCLLTALLCLEAARRKGTTLLSVLSGVVLGLLIIVRPIAIFLPLLFALYLFLRLTSKRKILVAGAVCIAAYATIFPWMLRNHKHFSSWNVSSVGAYNLAMYNAPEFLKIYPDQKAEQVISQLRAKQESLPVEDALSLHHENTFMQAFKTVISGRELQYASFHFIKTIPFFVSDGWRDIVRLFGSSVQMPNITSALMQGRLGELIGMFRYINVHGLVFFFLVLAWGMIFLLWLVTAFRSVFKKVSSFWLLISVIILYFALLTGPVSNARYRLPVEGLLIASALYAAYESELCKEAFVMLKSRIRRLLTTTRKS